MDMGPSDDNRDFLKDPPPPQQSIFQTPVDMDATPQAPPEDIVAAAKAKQAEQHERYQTWYKKRKQHCILSICVLGLSGILLALPTSNNDVFIIGAGILGCMSGAYIGYKRVDDFWARIMHTMPQVIWSIIALLCGWQQTGFIFVIVAAMWLIHFGIATIVAMKIHYNANYT